MIHEELKKRPSSGDLGRGSLGPRTWVGHFLSENDRPRSTMAFKMTYPGSPVGSVTGRPCQP